MAIVSRKKDWQILKEEHWYRIPVKSAPKILPKVKYLAFYQTKVFGEEKWQVNYYAEVKGIEIKKRIELLPDEVNHIRAREMYYKITIGDLIPLKKPIKSRRWRRIVFIPTTLNKLFKAEEINDLYHTSPIEEKLYNYLKRENIPTERQFFVRETKEPYALDFAVFCSHGRLNIECDGEKYHSNKIARKRDRERDNELTSLGWSILRFSGEKINKRPKDCLTQIKKTIRTLGGLPGQGR